MKADIRMRSHGLRQLVDEKCVASCQQTRCKLIVKTCYPHACYKLFQQVFTSLQMTNYKERDLMLTSLKHRFHVTSRVNPLISLAYPQQITLRVNIIRTLANVPVQLFP